MVRERGDVRRRGATADRVGRVPTHEPRQGSGGDHETVREVDADEENALASPNARVEAFVDLESPRDARELGVVGLQEEGGAARCVLHHRIVLDRDVDCEETVNRSYRQASSNQDSRA